jgi:hypothetical protein
MWLHVLKGKGVGGWVGGWVGRVEQQKGYVGKEANSVSCGLYQPAVGVRQLADEASEGP